MSGPALARGMSGWAWAPSAEGGATDPGANGLGSVLLLALGLAALATAILLVRAWLRKRSRAADTQP